MKPNVIIIGGATASGKTGLAIELAKKVNGEIISADSMQVYKYLNVGTAKVTIEEMQGIKHHIIDIIEPHQEFNVATFQKLAYEKIEEILNRGKTPIIVGGTGLYISSLVDNMKFIDNSSKELEVKNSMEKKITKYGENAISLLYKELLEIDPEAASKIPENNFKRVKRALEMYYLTGKTKTEQEKETKPKESQYNFITFVIDWPREVLYNRIEKRIDIMIKQGVIEEAKWLLNQNLNPKCTAMQAIGYKELFPYIKGEDTLEHCIDKLKLETRHYAKRQITWFKRVRDVIYIDSNLSIDLMLEFIQKNI